MDKLWLIENEDCVAIAEYWWRTGTKVDKKYIQTSANGKLYKIKNQYYLTQAH